MRHCLLSVLLSALIFGAAMTQNNATAQADDPIRAGLIGLDTSHVIAFTKSLAREVTRHQIRVNCVCPGPTDTPLFNEQPEKIKQALERVIPMRRIAQPSEIADAIAFFASDRSSFVTGQVLSVSGGLTMVD